MALCLTAAVQFESRQLPDAEMLPQSCVCAQGHT